MNKNKSAYRILLSHILYSVFVPAFVLLLGISGFTFGNSSKASAETTPELIDQDVITAGAGDDFYISDFMNIKRNETFQASYDFMAVYTEGIDLYVDGEVEAHVPGEITVKLSMNVDGQTVYDSVRILVYAAPYMSTDVVNRATGTDRFLPVVYNAPDRYNVYYDFSDNSAAHEENGYIKTDTRGSTKVDMHLVYDTGHDYKVTFTLNVTDPDLNADSVNVAIGGTVKLPVSGVVSGSAASTDDDLRVSFDGVNVSGIETGSNKNAEIFIDGRKFTLTFNVTNPRFDDTCYMLYKGSRRTVKIKGIKNEGTVNYRINGKNARLSGKTLKGIRKGNSYLTAFVDGKEIKVQVAVTSRKAYQAVKRELAIAKTRTVYSQARRMSPSYYDCSSLVYRAYRIYGVRFGYRQSWAPTAATIGYWCVKNKKVVSYKAVTDYNKLLPGDLIFFAYAGNNGRYRHISHIETYVGGGYDVSASSTYGRVVKYGTQSGNSKVVLIARPVE